MNYPYGSRIRKMEKVKLLNAFKREVDSAKDKYHLLLEMEQEGRQVSFSPADMAKTAYQTWKKAEIMFKNLINEMENEQADDWKELTEDGDSYPEPYTAVFAEDEEGAQYVASCDTEFKWYVSLGEETHYIPDYIEIVRWRPVESTEKPDLAWPIDLAETLAEELEKVVDTLDDASSTDDSAEELAEKITDTVRMVSKQLWELQKSLKTVSAKTEPVSACPEESEENRMIRVAAMVAKIRLTGSGDGELETSKRILNFLKDVKAHKLDGTVAELGINIRTLGGYDSSLFISIRDGSLESGFFTDRGFIKLPFDFPYPGKDMGKTLYERWDIIESHIYHAKEEQEKVWNRIESGTTIYLRRPSEAEKIIALRVKEKNEILVRAEDEFGAEYEFLKVSANVKYFADKDKAEAYLKATPVK